MTQGPPEGQEEAVRRLLAQSGGPEPLPPDVAARLDATLAGLVEQREQIGSEAGAGSETFAQSTPAERTVVPLRRQRWPKVLLAAAAVVVAGYGIGTVVQNGSISGVSGSSADSAATSGGAAAASPQQAESGGSGTTGGTPGPTSLRGAVVALHSGHLAADVRRLVGPSDTVRLPKSDNQAQGTKSFDASRCAPADLPAHSTWTPATYDGQPAALVLRPVRRAAEGRSVVAAEVRSCDGTLLDSATVRVR